MNRIINKFKSYKKDKLPKFQKLSNNNVIKKESMCTICLEDITNNNVKLDCSHEFHFHCLVSIIINTNNFNQCPNCRQMFKVPNVAFEINKKDRKIKTLETEIQLSKIEMRLILDLLEAYNHGSL